MVTDSVGLGAKDAVPAAFPGRTVIVDGHPALFVEMLQDRLVRPRIASNPELFANGIAVVAGGYNYPYWDPARFDRSIDQMIATLRAAGAAHILWVTLREVKPQFITASAWRQVQPYYWYFPTVNAHLRAALARHPDLSLADWAAVADSVMNCGFTSRSVTHRMCATPAARSVAIIWSIERSNRAGSQ